MVTVTACMTVDHRENKKSELTKRLSLLYDPSPKLNSYESFDASTPSIVLPTTVKQRAIQPDESSLSEELFEKVPFVTSVLVYFSFCILMFLGFINQLFFAPKVAKELKRKNYAPLYEPFEIFYMQYVYRRIKDCWNRPICSVPGPIVTLMDRETNDHGWTFKFKGTTTKCVNLCSYNYLGFAETTGPCVEDSISTFDKYGCAIASSRLELGSLPIHDELEKATARFLGVDDAIVFGMGFATNSLNLPSLLSEGCLVLSDQKNHSSIILGLRLSGATIRTFKHNNVQDLEDGLKKAIVLGQPANDQSWRKIVIVIEGIYSMEGTIARLPEIIQLKKKYKAYLYVDEAHSIGAMGNCGKGLCNYYGLDPKNIDILMGTFTKSFGSAGGYIAGTKALIDHLRIYSHAHTYASSMSPPTAQQIITAIKMISGEDGTHVGEKRTETLRRNTRYFRRRLKQMGLIVYGNDDSPVVPILVYFFSKISCIVRTLTTMKIAIAGVNYPATPLMEGRIRFCLSAAHTKEHLDYVLDSIEDVANRYGLNYSKKPRDSNPIMY